MARLGTTVSPACALRSIALDVFLVGNCVDAWNISTAHELHNYGCDEKCLNQLIHYERGNEIVSDSFRNPNLGYLHQRHVDRGKQDPALEFTQTLDCGYTHEATAPSSQTKSLSEIRTRRTYFYQLIRRAH